MVRPFDLNDATAIMQGILTSGLGLSPQRAHAVIRVPVPPLTDDRRRELTKVAKTFAEEARVAMRNIRRDALREAARLDMPEDDRRRFESELEDLVRRRIEDVDERLVAKTHDISGEEDRWRPS